MDTIFALATPPGKGGIAVTRLSGPRAFKIASKLCTLPEGRGMRYSTIQTVEHQIIDQALILSFEKGQSFTGEETVEFHTHGSIAVIDVLAQNLSLLGAVPAEPGAFTRIALENGNLSLVEVEALADLIDAETFLQHKQAIQAFSGGLRAEIESWREMIIYALALIESTIDFVEEDVPIDVVPDVTKLLYDLVQSMQNVLNRSSVGQRIRAGYKVAIVGRPNVGKSTLLNAIMSEDYAITSDIAGTTRDLVRAKIDLNGLLVELTDTAGLREAEDNIEDIGVNRAKRYAQDADLRIFLIENDISEVSLPHTANDIIVYNKADKRVKTDELSISGITGQGVSDLIDLLTYKLKYISVDDVVLIRERQSKAVHSAINEIQIAQALLERNDSFEIIAVHLYQAAKDMDFILGRVDVENILDEIFSSFCIGK